LEIARLGGGRVSKAKTFEVRYEAKVEFPGGGGRLNQKLVRGGGMDIFWNNTITNYEKQSVIIFGNSTNSLAAVITLSFHY